MSLTAFGCFALASLYAGFGFAFPRMANALMTVGLWAALAGLLFFASGVCA